MTDNELLFEPTKKKFNLLPIQYDKLWELRQTQVANHWVLNEIDLSVDIHQWKELKLEEQTYIKRILSFFATVDSVLLDAIDGSLLDEIQIPEARSFLIQMEAIEDIHNESYNFMVETLVPSEEEKQWIYDAITTEPVVSDKAHQAVRMMKNSRPGIVFLGQAILEQLFISASFVPFFWLRKKGIMPGMSMINQLASRDENLHGEFAAELHNMLTNKLDPEEVVEWVTLAVEKEIAFTKWVLPTNLMGMNADQMIQYVKYIGDQLMVAFGASTYYKVSNPFPWMDMISMETKTNFFETRNTEYRRVVGEENNSISFDAEF